MKTEDEDLFLYTFIFDLQGGTYITQVKATHPVDAKRRWAMQLQAEGIEGLEGSITQSMVQEVEGQNMVTITGTTNVWCLTLLLRDQFGMVHVIKTLQE